MGSRVSAGGAQHPPYGRGGRGEGRGPLNHQRLIAARASAWPSTALRWARPRRVAANGTKGAGPVYPFAPGPCGTPAWALQAEHISQEAVSWGREVPTTALTVGPRPRLGGPELAAPSVRDAFTTRGSATLLEAGGR